MPEQSIKQVLLNRRMLICVFTGFTSGLPLYVIYQLIPFWLREHGVSLTEIGFFALVGIPYTWKFLWSPLMDRYPVPLLGRRRGWMLVTQFALLLSIAGLGIVKPDLSLWTAAYLAAAVAFFSASQDVVIDAYRRELLSEEELGLGNTVHVQAYRIAGLVPGSLALILAGFFPWEAVYGVVAACMLFGIGLTLVIQDAAPSDQVPLSLRQAVLDPFKEFIVRKGLMGGALVLAFMFLYKLGDSMATALSYPFYYDLGFDGLEIGLIAKNAALWSAIVGGFVAIPMMAKLGINRALWVFGLVQIASILGFWVLAEVGRNPWLLGVVVSFEYLGVGLGTAAFIAYIARETSVMFAATQFALLTAVTALPRTFANAVTGAIIDSIGYSSFFLLCTGLALPGMLLLFKVAPWRSVDPQ